MGVQPPITLQLGMCAWTHADISRTDTLVDAVPHTWRNGISRYHRHEDLAASALARLVLKGLMCRAGVYHLFAERPMLLNEITQKPYFGIEGPVVHFNLSHTKGYAAAAIASVPVGVDVEHLRAVDFDSVQRTMTEAEWTTIFAQPNRMEAFLSLWSRKEAVVKAIGDGLRINPGSFEAIADLCTAGGYEWRISTFLIEPVVCSVAVQQNWVAAQPLWFSLKDLLSQTC